MASFSLHNIIALHRSDVLSNIFPSLWIEDKFPSSNGLTGAYRVTLTIRVSESQSAHQFIRKAYSSPSLYSTILKSLLLSKGPSVIQFDCSLHGYSSLELPSLGKQFPPTPSAGLTLSIWLRIDQFDPNCHITIFGAFDLTQTCFALAYIEKPLIKWSGKHL